MIRGLLCQTGLAWLPVTRRYSPRGRVLSENPGVGRRMKLFEKEQFNEEFDDLEDLESDFMNTHNSHKEVQKELRGHRDKLSSFIVKDKYFNSHSVNLLTYSEKEQIRHLHDSDREEWTVEKLAGSFPATEGTISKIIKAKWVFREAKKIEQHDRKVQQNWEALKEGSVPGVDETLRKHLLKFSDRRVEPVPVVEQPKRNLLELPKGEFSNIITSCKRVNSPQPPPLAIKAPFHNGSEQEKHVTPNLEYGSNTMLLDGVADRRPMTIELFRDSSGMLQPASSPGQSQPAATGSQVHTALGSRSAKVEMMPVPSQFDAKKKHFEIRDHITIPRKLKRPGATYKVDDSYFDDDGEFLYRVPGMNK